jgi:PAS domain-containing protein
MNCPDITGHASWQDMIGKQDVEIFPEETAHIYNEEELPIFREGKPLLNKINPYFDAAGNKGWISTNKWPLFDDEQHVVGLFGISRIITDHKQAQDALMESHRAYDEMVAQVPVGIYKLRMTPDGDMFFDYISPRFCRVGSGQ